MSFLSKLFRRLGSVYWRWMNLLPLLRGFYVKVKCRILYGSRVIIGEGFRVYGAVPIVKVSLSHGGRITVGSNVTLVNSTKYNYSGIYKPCSLVAEHGELVIGNGVGMSGVSIYSNMRIEIGDSTIIGSNCFIFDTDFHATDPASRKAERTLRNGAKEENIMKLPVRIGANVFLGLGVMVLKGVSIGDNAIVGAGVVVASNIESGVTCVCAKNRILA